MINHLFATRLLPSSLELLSVSFLLPSLLSRRDSRSVFFGRDIFYETQLEDFRRFRGIPSLPGIEARASIETRFSDFLLAKVSAYLFVHLRPINPLIYEQE